MKALKVCGFAFIFGLMATGMSMGADLKIAYVDLAKVFDNYPETKDFDAQLQAEGQQFETTRDGMIQKIRDAQSKLALMNDTQKASMEADIEKQKNEVIAYDKEKREDLAKRRDEKVKQILGKIQGVVSDVAKKEGYTYVLNDRVMVYGDPSFDITSDVMKSLNETAS